MSFGGGFEAGRVFALLGFDVDSSGAERYERRLAQTERKAKDPITTKAGIKVDDDGFRRYDDRVDRAERSTGRLRVGMGRVGSASASMATGISAAGIAIVATGAAVTSLVGAYEESAKIGAQTEAVIKSTGGAAKVTAKDVGELAGALSRKTAVDDEAIQSGANLLLTFTNVRNEAGRGNAIFDRTVQVMNDMSVALGQDTKSSALQLGKALNDPIKGVTALQRVGVSFTASQKDQIKTLVESGKTVDAQKLILRELTKEFGGSAAAQATSTDRLKVTLGNLAETVGGKLAPVVQGAAEKLDGFLDDLLNGKGPAKEFGDTLRGIGDAIGDAVDTIEQRGKAVVGFVGEVVRENEDTFRSIGKTISSIARSIVRAIGQVGSALSSVFGDGAGTTRDLRKIITALLSFSAVALKVADAIVDKALPGIVQAFRGVATTVRGIIRVIAGVLTLDFGKAWDGVKDIFRGSLLAIAGTLKTFTAPIRAAASAIWRPLRTGATAAWDAVTSTVNKGLDGVLGGVTSVMGAMEDVVRVGAKLPFVGGKFRGLADDIGDARKSIDRYRQSLRDTDDEHKRSPKRIRALRDEIKDLKGDLGRLKKGSDDYRDTAEKLRKKQGQLSDELRATRGPSRTAKRAIDTVSASAGAAGGLFGDVAKSLTDNLNSALEQMGARPVKVTARGLGRQFASAAKSVVAAVTNAFAGGGFVGARGERGHDDTLVNLADGSAVANHHQIPIIEAATRAVLGRSLSQRLTPAGGGPGGGQRALVGRGERILDPHEASAADWAMQQAYGGFGLDDLFASVTRPHAYASGGRVNLMGAKPGLASYALAALKYGLRVSSGLRPGAITSSGNPSQHGAGDAIDLAGAAGDMLRFAREFGARFGGQVDQLIHTPLGYGYSGGRKVPLSFFGPAVNADHFDHVHLGDSTPGGAVAGLAGAAGAALKRLTITGDPGPLLDLARGMNSRLGKAAQAYLDKRAGAAMGSHAGGVASGIPPGAGALWGATTFGGPGDPATGTTGYKGDNLLQKPNSFAELDMGSAMGGLPYMARVRVIAPGGKSAIAYKRDIGAGGGPVGGHKRGIDLWWQLAQRLGLPDVWSGVVRVQRAARGAWIRRFTAGGRSGKAKAKKKPTLKDQLDGRYDLTSKQVRALRGLQNDRVEAYDDQLARIDDLGKDYGLQERRNDLTDEVLIDDKGAVNEGDVRRRVAELAKLLKIRRQIRDRMRDAQRVARRAVKTYLTLISRTKAALAAARKSKSKSRKSAISSYQKALSGYREALDEWRGKRKDIGYDLQDAGLDIEALKGERDAVAGTKPEPKDPDLGGGGDSGEASPDPVQLPASPEDIARAAAEQFASFQASRADLFGSFGSNFTRGGADPFASDGARAAGMRFFGGGSGGADGGVVAAAGGAPAAPSAAQVTVNNYFTSPTPPNPHELAAATGHEIRALV